MRASVLAALMALAASACTGGDGASDGGAGTSSTAAPAPSSTAPPTTVTTVPATPPATDPAGSVTLRMTAFTLPDPGPGGTGLRVVVRAASPALRVRRKGAGGAVSACPVGGATTAVTPSDCVALEAGATVELPAAGGVELRAARAGAAVEEVGVTYVPADRTTTVVTPARPAGACAARPCETTFSLTPGRAGPFVLDGRAGGGRPRLVLISTPVAGGSNRTLATVEGGGSLSIRATLEAGAAATLLHHEQGDGAVVPVTAEISWP